MPLGALAGAAAARGGPSLGRQERRDAVELHSAGAAAVLGLGRAFGEVEEVRSAFEGFFQGFFNGFQGFLMFLNGFSLVFEWFFVFFPRVSHGGRRFFMAEDRLLQSAAKTPEELCCTSLWSQPTVAADGRVYVNWAGGKLFSPLRWRYDEWTW